jgi:hypothetical protein
VGPDRLDVLKNRLIRFTPPAVSNDLTDFLPRLVDSDALGESVARSYGSRRLAEEHPELPTEVVQVLVDLNVEFLRAGHGAMHRFLQSYIHAMRSEFGVLSLTEDPLHPAMWAHYANNSAGFIISFRPDHRFFFPEEGPRWLNNLEPVIYSRRRTYSSNTIDGAALMFEKDAKWAFEREWRQVRKLRSADRVENNIHLFSLSPDVLNGIILGPRMSTIDREALLAIVYTDAEYAHLKVSEVIVKNERLTLRTLREPKGESGSFFALLWYPDSPLGKRDQ